jgi:hypothetical protein
MEVICMPYISLHSSYSSVLAGKRHSSLDSQDYFGPGSVPGCREARRIQLDCTQEIAQFITARMVP